MIHPMNFQQVQPQSITPTGIASSIGDISSGNCALFLFTPRDINPHHKRPLTYNMNNHLIESITENVFNNPASHSVQTILNTSPDIQKSIVPVSQGGFNVATDTYSENWMFVLIVDEGGMTPIGLTNKLLTRTILIGICAQEPISHSGMMSMTPEQFINPHCNLVVTKRFQMSKIPTEGAHGRQYRIKATHDDNIVQFDPNIWETNRIHPDQSSFFTMMPGEVQGVASMSDDGFTSFVKYEDSLNVKGSARINAHLESPKQHMKEILNTFETGFMNTNFSNQIGTFGDGQTVEDTSFESYVKSAFEESRVLNDASNNIAIQDITAAHLTLGMVMMNYHPKVFPITTPRHSNADIIPQHVTSIGNVFSSLVCAVLPTYLNAVCLSAVSFMYNSVHDAFNVLHVESVINISQQELQFKWNALTLLLKKELFPVLYGNGGPFDMQVMCSVNSTTDVILNFLDYDMIPIGAIYQENAVLGGIVSPLIGTADHLKYNSVQINNLIRNVGAHVSPIQY